jgi:NAD(P)H-hydrate epimerase
MYKFVSVAEMVAIEKAADAAGLTYEKMMANAGKALAETVQNAYSHLDIKSIIGLVGKGNNGGDTIIALEHLQEEGWETAAYVVGNRKGDVLLKSYIDKNGRVYYHDDDSDLSDLSKFIQSYKVLLDGLLGTGIRLPLRNPFPLILSGVADILRAMEHPPQVVAVDCPSGVDCDSGEAALECIPADLTVCMAAVKKGLLAFPAYDYLGELKVVGIGLPTNLAQMNKIIRFVPNCEYLRDALPFRPLNSHKGTFGTALIVAGSQSYSGAVILAGKAAFRSGAGWINLAIPSVLHTALAGSFIEATWLLLPQENGFVSGPAAGLIFQNLEKPTAVLVGPGLGLEKTTEEFFERFIKAYTTIFPPLIIDADGLKLLTKIKNWHSKLPPLTILTPHPGEMAILTGLDISEIQRDRISVAETYAKEWGHVIVLKGAFTVIAEPGGETAILSIATPALARAGTGDVLAGIITGLRAQGMGAFSAAVAGAYIHAKAGVMAADNIGGTAGILAGDLINFIPGIINR